MEREQDRWKRIYRAVRTAAGLDHHSRHVHKDSLIVGVLLWAVLNERPISWACVKDHWPGAIRPAPLPSQSCMSRRLKTIGVSELLTRTYQYFQEQLPAGLLKFIDAKPLPVGGCSKDPDALYGRAASCKAKGYKLFVILDATSKAVDQWMLGPMSQSEQQAGRILLERLQSPAVVLGDGAYDTSTLYDLAASRDCALLAPAPANGKGVGHHYVSPYRKDGLSLARSSVGAELLMARIGIEQYFGSLTSSSGGLSPLPAWVRRPHRVAVWVAAKLIIDLDRRIRLREQKPNAA